LRCFNEAIELKPDYVDALIERGNTHYQNDNSLEAEEDFNEAIRIQPDCVEAYIGRGLARPSYHGEEAIQDFDEAIRRKPDCAEAFYYRGQMREDAFDHDGAIEDLSEAIRLKPDYDAAYLSRAMIFNLFMDRYESAIADYRKYLDLVRPLGINSADIEATIRELEQKL
jgi:tetratricopeptide (TPR) repeat protein